MDIYDINQEIWITYLRVKKDSILNFFIKPNVILKTNILGIMNNVIAHPLILFFEMESLSDFIMNIKGCNDTINISEIKNILNCTDGAVIVDPEGNECQCLDWGH